MAIEGVLFLTAGYGTRAEPLSLIRPKALLPCGGTTVLGRLASQISVLDPGKISANCSRCPGLLRDELTDVWPDRTCTLYFENRPLGASATLARNARSLEGGTWMLANTDMIIRDPQFEEMVLHHKSTGSHWTVLAGGFPETGHYSPLIAGDGGFLAESGKPVHYWGVSLIEPAVSELAMATQENGNLFSGLAAAAADRGLKLGVFHADGNWLDMGNVQQMRENILSCGSHVHTEAEVSDSAVLRGSWNIGKGCNVAEGAVITDSVMLEGSSVYSGAVTDTIVPWECRIDGGSE